MQHDSLQHRTAMARHLRSRDVDGHPRDGKVYEINVLTPVTVDKANTAASGTFISLSGDENELPESKAPSKLGDVVLQLRNVTRTVAALQNQLDHTAHERNELQNHLNRTAQQCGDLQTQLDHTAHERNELQNHLNRTAQQCGDLQTQLDHTAHERNELRRFCHRLQGHCHRLQGHNAALQGRISNVEHRFMSTTIANASYGILGLLSPRHQRIGPAAEIMAGLSAAAFAARLPRGLLPPGADIHRVHQEFKELVDFSVGSGSFRNNTIHPRTWPEFHDYHGTNIMDLMRTPRWREHPLGNVAAFIARVAVFAQAQHEQEAQ